jgi:UPF0755 protein
MEEYQIEKTKAGLLKIILLSAILVLVIVAVAASFYLTKAYKPGSNQSMPVEFTVEKGDTTKDTGYALRETKLISNANVFFAYVYIHGAAGKIQAGTYELDRNMSIAEITDILTRGKVVSNARNVTVIEGWSNAQIGNYLEQREIVSSIETWNETLASGEFDFKFNETASKFDYQGFLFPDTYKLGKSEDVEALVQKMLSHFEGQVTDKMIADLEAQGRTLGEAMILASIIEKEVGRNKETLTDEDLTVMQKERELVASVFLNRLEVGMALESDATVNYVTGKKDRSATIADTKVKSPYNTYQNRGLPPGPISNPGIGAITAAIYPAQSDYLYFLNSPEGVAYYAKDLAGHVENREKYLR